MSTNGALLKLSYCQDPFTYLKTEFFFMWLISVKLDIKTEAERSGSHL